MLIQSLAYLPTIAVLIILAWMVWRKHPEGMTHRFFASFLFLVSLWLAIWYLADTAKTPDQALFFIRLSRVFTPFAVYAFLIFSLLFPIKIKRLRLWSTLAILPALFFSLTAFYPQNTSAAEISGWASQPAQVGWLNFGFFVYTALYFMIAFGVLIAKLKYVSIRHQSQIKLIILSTFASVAINIVLIVFPHSESLDWLAAMSTPTVLIGALGVTYAVTYFDLFDIRSLIFRSIIPVAPYLRVSGDRVQTFLTLQTIAKEADAHNVALDFSGVKSIDPDVARGIVNLKDNLQTQFNKQIYFIGCAPSVRKLLSPRR